jgi:NAD(P)H-flavin reductase
MNLVACSVVENREIAPGNYLLTLKVPRGFSRPEPGQFVHLRVSPETEPLLRRPYSLEGFVERGSITPSWGVAPRCSPRSPRG